MMRDEAERPSGSEGTYNPSETRLYNPYADLFPGGLNSESLDNIYRLPNAPEFLFKEEAAIQRRSFGDNLTFITGCGWLGGATVGGLLGFAEGIRLQEEGDTRKIRINRILNSTGQRGRNFGNTLGVVGLLYGGIEGASCHFRGTDDIFNSVIAGLGTGSLYKAAAGPRTAAIAGAVGGAAAAALAAGKHLSKRGLKSLDAKSFSGRD